MTDRDDSSEGFLGRWSRKKIEGERDTPDAPADAGASDGLSPEAAPAPQPPVANAAKPAPKVEFDLTSLPSLDSIAAGTDIRAFLAPGVPSELARAALRRAWSADPAIRNFVGLAENAWDFTDPSAMAGFGELPPGTDIKKLLAQVFGERDEPVTSEHASEPAGTQAPQCAEEIPPSAPAAADALTPGSAKDASPASPMESHQAALQSVPAEVVQRNIDIASHNDSSTDEPDAQSHRRPHGGALPQ